MMNEQTQAKLDALVQYLCDSVKDGGDFLRDQAPLVAKEIVSWTFAIGLLGTIVSLAILLVILTFGVLSLRRGQWSDSADPENKWAVGQIICGLLLAIWLAAGMPYGMSCAHDAIKAACAPRLVVLDYLRGLKP